MHHIQFNHASQYDGTVMSYWSVFGFQSAEEMICSTVNKARHILFTEHKFNKTLTSLIQSALQYKNTNFLYVKMSVAG